MISIKTPIIPIQPTFVGTPNSLDYKAICIFSALGFFLDNDTYFLEQKALKPGHVYNIEGDTIVNETPYFSWHYTPKERSFSQVVLEFGTLFESIIKEQTQGKQVILPLSGGLDSRTQAVALARIGANVRSYSYRFQGGHNESAYGENIAKLCDFPFQDFTVPNGYLWPCIEDLATINGCYSEFTHPRQMAFKDAYTTMGNVFSLGHWGDVMFDDMGIDDDLNFDGQVDVLFKKIIKKGGLELANKLWKHWGLEGEFKDYLYNRISKLHAKIPIKNNANARVRAFKSMYWAPRWTSVNLSVFASVHPITLPYYDSRMCEFICTVPERYLANRQIQIAYIKQHMEAVAKVTWQDQRPFNLLNYHYNKTPWNLPYRVYDKLKRSLHPNAYIMRNWELQFLGAQNANHLEQYLFNEPLVSK
ncbi:MAG: asparagine synthetase B family protein, partial [Winogradskyella arenosi]